MSREIEIVAQHHWALLTDFYGDLRRIGSGDQGIVYAMEDRPGHVLKMSCTSGDAFIASYTMRWPARFCTQVPEFKELATLRGYYLTVREDLPDARFTRTGADGVEEMLDTVANSDGLTPAQLDARLEDGVEDFLNRYEIPGARLARTLFKDVRALLVWARENGIYVSDAHADNWGMRDGVYVLRDWGCCAPDLFHADHADADAAFDAVFTSAKLDP